MIFLFIFLQPILSEVLNDAPGSETQSGRRNEWIEVYNPGPDTLDLSLYGITDFDEPIDSIVAWTDSLILRFHPGVIFGKTKLPPLRFGVILDPDYTDTLNTEYPQPYRIDPGTYIFKISDKDIGNNGSGLALTDPIAIFELSNPSIYVSTFGINGVPFTSGHDGISIERIILEGPDSTYNWGKSTDPTKSTPGRFNSVSPGFDLTFKRVYVKPTFIKINENFSVYFLIKNAGTLTYSGNIGGYIKILNTKNFELDTTIKGGDSVLYSITTQESKRGIFNLELKINPVLNEKDTFNNTSSFKVIIDTHLIYITEIFYNGSPEWIEIKTNSRDTVFLNNFILMDETKKTCLINNIKIPGDTYAIFTSDTLSFYGVYGKIPFTFQLSNFPAFNNDGDLVFITDNLKERIDSVRYYPDWGGSYGISLERYSFGTSWLKENWGSSQDPKGATPGRGPYKIEMGENKLILKGRRFTPNNDGKDEEIEIWISPSKELSSLYLYDSAGFLKHTFFENQVINFPKLIKLTKNNIGLKKGLYIVVLKQGNKIYKNTFVYFE
ncbi:MAG: hypothetical protein ABIN20_01110 [candidate division WOR-3 bacterium]